MAMVSKLLSMAVGVGMQGYFTYKDYQHYRQEGNSVPVTALKTAGSFAFWDMLGQAGMFFGLGQAAYQITKASGQMETMGAENLYNKRGKFGSGYAPVSEAGYTMRQRSLNAIRQNGLNVNSVIGNEARQYYGRY